jgi:hypothetical protein
MHSFCHIFPYSLQIVLDFSIVCAFSPETQSIDGLGQQFISFIYFYFFLICMLDLSAESFKTWIQIQN